MFNEITFISIGSVLLITLFVTLFKFVIARKAFKKIFNKMEILAQEKELDLKSKHKTFKTLNEMHLKINSKESATLVEEADTLNVVIKFNFRFIVVISAALALLLTVWKD